MGRRDYRDLGWQGQGKDTKGQARTVCGKEDHVQGPPGRKEEAAKVGREAGKAGRHAKENSRLAKEQGGRKGQGTTIITILSIYAFTSHGLQLSVILLTAALTLLALVVGWTTYIDDRLAILLRRTLQSP